MSLVNKCEFEREFKETWKEKSLNSHLKFIFLFLKFWLKILNWKKFWNYEISKFNGFKKSILNLTVFTLFVFKNFD